MFDYINIEAMNSLILHIWNTTTLLITTIARDKTFFGYKKLGNFLPGHSFQGIYQ